MEVLRGHTTSGQFARTRARTQSDTPGGAVAVLPKNNFFSLVQSPYSGLQFAYCFFGFWVWGVSNRFHSCSRRTRFCILIWRLSLLFGFGEFQTVFARAVGSFAANDTKLSFASSADFSYKLRYTWNNY